MKLRIEAHLDILVCQIYHIIEQILKNYKLSDAICIFAASQNLECNRILKKCVSYENA